MIGEVFGNYRVTAKLGEGGMGAVYLAEHPSIGRKVAVKIIRPVFSNDQETLRRFVREARSTAGLRHPALVDIMDYGVHEKTGSAYIIMEYLEGESLDARLERLGVLPPRQAAEIARQIALGMAAAHRAGIIHRDLKPGNVHLTPDPDRPGVDVVKVLDFGIAKLANNDTGAGPTTRSDVLLGTPRYMAPEQCRGGGAFDHRVDVYSLGCLLYETLAGRPPFDYQWPGELIAAHLGEAPPPLRALAPAVSEALEAVVMRAIAKHPDHRQATMSHLAKELEPFLGIDVSFPPVAVGPSVAPSLPIAAAPAPARAPDAATTTASVVMRHRGGALVEPAAVRGPNDAALGQASPAPSIVPSPAEFLPRPLLRRGLIAGGLFAAVTGVVVAIATTSPSNAPSTVAKSVILSPATAPTDTAGPLEQVARTEAAPSTAEARPANGESTAPAADLLRHGAPMVPSSDGEPTGSEQEADEPSSAPPAAPASQRAAAPASPRSAGPPAAENAASPVRIRVANPRPGLRVTVDGHQASLPVRLPRDQKAHVLAFTAPNFKIETKTVVADQDHTLTLEYRPKLYVP